MKYACNIFERGDERLAITSIPSPREEYPPSKERPVLTFQFDERVNGVWYVYLLYSWNYDEFERFLTWVDVGGIVP